MNQFVALPPRLPALVAAGGEHASMCFLEFFAANIRNSHTRLADRRRSARSRPDRAHGQFLRPDRRGAWVAVEDVFTQNRRLWYRLREKGGKRHAMPCHHILEEYLIAYLDGAGRRGDPKGPLFRTMGRGTGQLTRTVRPQANAYATIRRRAAPAGVETEVGNHTFPGDGITAYLKNGGTLEKAAAMANRASTRAPQLYDLPRNELSLDEVERIAT